MRNCPVCGFPLEDAYVDESALASSYDICAACECEFGYDDVPGQREAWLERGTPWFKPSLRPAGVDLLAQLAFARPDWNIARNAPAEVREYTFECSHELAPTECGPFLVVARTIFEASQAFDRALKTLGYSARPRIVRITKATVRPEQATYERFMVEGPFARHLVFARGPNPSLQRTRYARR